MSQSNKNHLRPTKRVSQPLSTKIEALELLGIRPDETKGPAAKNPQTFLPYKQVEIANRFGVAPGVISMWRKRAAEIFAHGAESARSKRVCRIRAGNFPELEHALWHYMQNVMSFMNGESIFRDTEVIAKALDLKEEMLIKLNRKLEVADPGSDLCRKCEKAITRMESFKASVGWTQSFKARKAIDSRRGIGDGGFFVSSEIESARVEARKQICSTSIHDLANTDEVACLYRSFPSRTIRSVSFAHSYKRVKDRLTAVLTIFADRTKAPLIIIGKTRRPRSFPRRFNPLRDLNVFQMTQKNAWNTKEIWTRTVEGFDKLGRLEARKLKVVLDNCSAHLINYEYDNYEVCLLPPNLTSHLQPVDACVGRSFKCIYRRLICRHVLRQVDKLLELPAEERPIFKLSDFVTLYDAFELMAEAWNRVPKRVVLKSWLKSNILAPHQIQEVKDISRECR